jgi:hypothetical protein
MAPISPKGSPHAPVWVVIEQPYPQDVSKGYVFSEGYGYVFERMMQDAGIQDYYVIPRRSDFDHLDTYTIIESLANQYRPPIIIPLGNSLGFFCPETKKKLKAKKNQSTPQEEEADLEKYAGSLLTSPLLTYPHFICSTVPPDVVVRDWNMRDICVSLDLGKAKSELDYVKKHGQLEPLPIRRLVYDFEEPGRFPELIDRIRCFRNRKKLISTDIESVYPQDKSKHKGHPGIPTVIGLADSSIEGISFKFFRDSLDETRILWRELYETLLACPLLGQNFFDFDATRFEILGYQIDYNNITDTMIRQHILWPELPKKLQFMTKQYTREPYYKDESTHWNGKDMRRLKRYNGLDVCVTYEVYEKQEAEFEERPHLR